MKKFSLNYAYWLLSRGAKTLGTWGLVGLIISIGSVVFYMTNVVKSEQQLLLAQYELDSTRKKDSVFLPPLKTTKRDLSRDISKFYGMFPDGASLPKWLNLIDSTATKQHLLLDRGDYKLTKTKQGQLSRYEIVLPLIGEYIQIRQFIAEVLQLLPALALSDMQIKRENSLSSTVEARLVFVLFLQGDSW